MNKDNTPTASGDGVRNARGQFAHGNPGGRNKANKPAPRMMTIDALRADLLSNWGRLGETGLHKFLDKLRKQDPQGYAKLMVSLVPKDRDAVVHRRIVMVSFIEPPARDWRPEPTDHDVVEVSADDADANRAMS